MLIYVHDAFSGRALPVKSGFNRSRTQDQNLERRDPFFSAHPQQTQKVGLVMSYSQLPGRWLSVTHVGLGQMIVIIYIGV